MNQVRMPRKLDKSLTEFDLMEKTRKTLEEEELYKQKAKRLEEEKQAFREAREIMVRSKMNIVEFAINKKYISSSVNTSKT